MAGGVKIEIRYLSWKDIYETKIIAIFFGERIKISVHRKI